MDKWNTLLPEKLMIAALDASGPRPQDAEGRDPKHRWSNKFADACARMLAKEIHKKKLLGRPKVYPDQDGKKVESLTAVGASGQGKRVDIAVCTESEGLQMAISLKAANFRDPRGGHFGKNLTGRLYEALNEVRAIHEFHPHSVFVLVFHFPISACTDASSKSTFASAIAKLRESTGRNDRSAPTQFGKFDAAYVGLYQPEESGPIERGVCRYFDVHNPPPLTGRPKVPTTMSLADFIEELSRLHSSRGLPQIEYAEPEGD